MLSRCADIRLDAIINWTKNRRHRIARPGTALPHNARDNFMPNLVEKPEKPHSIEYSYRDSPLIVSRGSPLPAGAVKHTPAGINLRVASAGTGRPFGWYFPSLATARSTPRFRSIR